MGVSSAMESLTPEGFDKIIFIGDPGQSVLEASSDRWRIILIPLGKSSIKPSG